MTVGSPFAGIGGFDLAAERAGLTVKWQVEIDPFCQKVLEKHWPHVTRRRDVREVHAWDDCDCHLCLGRVDVVCGGFPCQDISVAGPGAGLAGARSGLWFEMRRIVGVRGFADSGDKCPACHAPGWRHAVEEDIIEIDDDGKVRALVAAPAMTEHAGAGEALAKLAEEMWSYEGNFGPRTGQNILKWSEQIREAAALLTEQSRQLEALMRIAKEATNGWACHAKGKAEHAEIARLHAAIAVLSQSQP
jgi:hypothetical protein